MCLNLESQKTCAFVWKNPCVLDFPFIKKRIIYKCRTKLHFVGLKMYFVGLNMRNVGLNYILSD
jgi:hypothetical protein